MTLDLVSQALSVKPDALITASVLITAAGALAWWDCAWKRYGLPDAAYGVDVRCYPSAPRTRYGT